MFVCSVRFSRAKAIACCMALLMAIAAAGILPRVFAKEEENSPVTTVSMILQGVKIADNDARVEYLRSYGWEVEAEPEAIEEIVVPEEFSEVFEKYNAIQKEQGFDLTRQKGQRVKRYTYIVTNYPDEPDYVRANLLVCKDKVVGGDICSLKVQGGFLHGFEAPEAEG